MDESWGLSMDEIFIRIGKATIEGGRTGIIISSFTQSSHFWLMEGILGCYVQENPSGEENL
jgi:hypothetical protein